MCANWLTARLLQIGATVNIPMVQEIYTDLDVDPKVDLLEPFTTYNPDWLSVSINAINLWDYCGIYIIKIKKWRCSINIVQCTICRLSLDLFSIRRKRKRVTQLAANILIKICPLCDFNSIGG